MFFVVGIGKIIAPQDSLTQIFTPTVLQNLQPAKPSAAKKPNADGVPSARFSKPGRSWNRHRLRDPTVLTTAAPSASDLSTQSRRGADASLSTTRGKAARTQGLRQGPRQALARGSGTLPPRISTKRTTMKTISTAMPTTENTRFAPGSWGLPTMSV